MDRISSRAILKPSHVRVFPTLRIHWRYDQKLEKVHLVAGIYARLRPRAGGGRGTRRALSLRGRVFPRREERVLSVGFSVILKAVASIVAKDPRELGPVLRHHGDIGAGAEKSSPIIARHLR